jgi:hypothetical protein
MANNHDLRRNSALLFDADAAALLSDADAT